MIVPLILAAGESRRLGSPKALLDFDGRPCLVRIIELCRRAGTAGPIVVLGHAAAEIGAVVPAGIETVIHPDYRRGQTSSLRAGLRRLPAAATGFLLYPVDHPLVRPETLKRLLATEGPIVVPVHDGRRGHPARFDRALVAEFLALGNDDPAHRVVRLDPDRVIEIPVDDPGVTLPMNTPAEYRACLERYRAAGAEETGSPGPAG